VKLYTATRQPIPPLGVTDLKKSTASLGRWKKIEMPFSAWRGRRSDIGHLRTRAVFIDSKLISDQVVSVLRMIRRTVLQGGVELVHVPSQQLGGTINALPSVLEEDRLAGPWAQGPNVIDAGDQERRDASRWHGGDLGGWSATSRHRFRAASRSEEARGRMEFPAVQFAGCDREPCQGVEADRARSTLAKALASITARTHYKMPVNTGHNHCRIDLWGRAGRR